MYLEAVDPKPSCDTRVLVEAGGLEERVSTKPNCDTLVLLEAIWLEGRGAAKPSCDMFRVPRATPDDKLDLDSGLELHVVPQQSSESLDAVETVQWSLSFPHEFDPRTGPTWFNKLDVPVDATEHGLSGVLQGLCTPANPCFCCMGIESPGGPKQLAPGAWLEKFMRFSGPSCDKIVLLEAVGLEKRVASLLEAVGVAPKLSCDTLVLLEAIWLKGRGAPKPSCDVFGVPRTIPGDKIDLDSGLRLHVVPQPSSE